MAAGEAAAVEEVAVEEVAGGGDGGGGTALTNDQVSLSGSQSHANR